MNDLLEEEGLSPEEGAEIDPRVLLQFHDAFRIEGIQRTLQTSLWEELIIANRDDPDEVARVMDECSARYDYWRSLAGLAHRDYEETELYYDQWWASVAAQARELLRADGNRTPTDKAVKDRVILLHTDRYIEWQKELIALRERLNRYESAARAWEKRCATLPSVAKLIVALLEMSGGLALYAQAKGHPNPGRVRVESLS